MSDNWRPMTGLLVHGRPCDTKEGSREMQWICQVRLHSCPCIHLLCAFCLLGDLGFGGYFIWTSTSN